MTGPALQIIEIAGGAGIIAMTLWDIFSTVFVPGPLIGRLRMTRRLRQITLPLARRSSQRRPGKRPSNAFGPLVFILAFVAWVLLLVIGFGLLLHALAYQFSPPLTKIDQAFYVAGSSLMTLGVSEVDAHGLARWLILAAATAGLAVITAVITFVSQLQAGLHQRESRVLTLSGMAGSPISGLGLLETYAGLGLHSELEALFREWRDWSASMLHSHVTFPMLVYFHSVDAESDWLGALEAVLDAATMIVTLTSDRAKGAATLMHRSGARTVTHLCRLFDLEAESTPRPETEVATIIAQLQRAGFQTLPADDDVIARFCDLRDDYAGRVRALARHLGADRVRLSSSTE